MTLMLISLLAGVLTVLAPCVLPLLPIIVGGSLNGSRRLRPYIVAASLALSVIGCTLLLKASTTLAGLSQSLLNGVAGGVIILLGIVSIVPEAWEWAAFHLHLPIFSQRLLGQGERARDSLLGTVLVGLALGPVFSSCSPTYAFILASVLPKSYGAGLAYLSAYCIGLVGILLVIALLGQRAVRHLSWASDTHSVFRRAVGVIFLVFGLLIASGQETSFETWLAGYVPFDETGWEQALLSSQQPTVAGPTVNDPSNGILNTNAVPAPELAGLSNWLNSPAETLAGLQGKVVLVDFWTYSCINCNRALPYVEKWYKTYNSAGFTVIGVHTPEFAFEHDPANVSSFVKASDITYPVALDNSYDTWNAYQNNTWPADYLIDQTGHIRYVAYGEGGYDKTERAIQYLLGLSQPLQTANYTVPISAYQTPETYLGTKRAENYAGAPALANGNHIFTLPTATLPLNEWGLSGAWQVNDENIMSTSSTATIKIHVAAKDVYVVAGGQNQVVTISVKPEVAGQGDVNTLPNSLTLNGDKLYHIISLKGVDSATVTLTVPKGVSLYSFTFGS